MTSALGRNETIPAKRAAHTINPALNYRVGVTVHNDGIQLLMAYVLAPYLCSVRDRQAYCLTVAYQRRLVVIIQF